MNVIMSGNPFDFKADDQGPFRAADGRLLRIDDLPIPEDATIGVGWSPFMVELADHIGAYATLKLLDALGGESIRVSGTEAQRELFAAAIGAEKAAAFQSAFKGCKLDLPVARDAIVRAKSKPVLQAVAQEKLNTVDAARILRVARTRIWTLLNEPSRATAARLNRRTDRAQQPPERASQ